jgi:hypothetical protein
MNEVGNKPKADARLIADIDAADPFDGGCAADCETPRLAAQPGDVTGAAACRLFGQSNDQSKYPPLNANETLAMELGIQSCITKLCQMDMWTAADALKEAHSRGEVLK